MAPWPMSDLTSYAPRRVPGWMGTAPSLGLGPSLSASVLAPAAPAGDDAGHDRERDLARRHGPDIEADRALDAFDDALLDSLRAQGFEMVARVPAASDQADEARILGQDRFERLHQVGSVVVCVHRVKLSASVLVQPVEIAHSSGPVSAAQALGPGLDKQSPEAQLWRNSQQRLCDRRRS